MSLLAVLLAVILQYFAERNDFLSVPNSWMAGYWKLMSSHLTNIGWKVGIPLVTAPILLALLAVQLLSTFLLKGLLDFALVLLVLLITLQVRNYNHLLAPYTKALTEQDWESGARIVGDLTGGSVQAKDFTQANQQLRGWVSADLFKNWFVGLFWFGVLGIYGAATYWLWRRLAAERKALDVSQNSKQRKGKKQESEQEQNQAVPEGWGSDYVDGLRFCLYWAEYLPARLWTAGYALVGEFVPTFDWLAQELWGSLPSEQMVVQGSALALGLSAEAGANDDAKKSANVKKNSVVTGASSTLLELQQTIRLNLRLLVVWFVLLLFSGAWAVLMR